MVHNPHVLKELSAVLSKSKSLFFRNYSMTVWVPLDWCKADVAPIFKRDYIWQWCTPKSLLNLFINYIELGIKSTTSVFADDTKLCSGIMSLQDVCNLQADLKVDFQSKSK